MKTLLTILAAVLLVGVASTAYAKTCGPYISGASEDVQVLAVNSDSLCVDLSLSTVTIDYTGVGTGVTVSSGSFDIGLDATVDSTEDWYFKVASVTAQWTDTTDPTNYIIHDGSSLTLNSLSTIGDNFISAPVYIPIDGAKATIVSMSGPTPSGGYSDDAFFDLIVTEPLLALGAGTFEDYFRFTIESTP